MRMLVAVGLAFGAGCAGQSAECLFGQSSTACQDDGYRGPSRAERRREKRERATTYATVQPRCDAGDANACMQAADAAPDERTTFVATRRACELGRVEGCRKLPALDKTPVPEDLRPQVTTGLQLGCDALSDAESCQLLGYRLMISVPFHPDWVAAAFARACDLSQGGLASECVLAGNLYWQGTGVLVTRAKRARARALWTAGCHPGGVETKSTPSLDSTAACEALGRASLEGAR